jgi:hypothetical protein
MENIRIYKESVLADTKLSDKEKEQIFADLKEFAFIKNGYLIYFFRLESPALVKQGEFKFTFNDQSGNPMIKKILPMGNKVTSTFATQYTSATYVDYNYVWVMMLNKPLTPANYPAGTYKLSIIVPNGSTALYVVDNTIGSNDRSIRRIWK